MLANKLVVHDFKCYYINKYYVISLDPNYYIHITYTYPQCSFSRIVDIISAQIFVVIMSMHPSMKICLNKL